MAENNQLVLSIGTELNVNEGQIRTAVDRMNQIIASASKTSGSKQFKVGSEDTVQNILQEQLLNVRSALSGVASKKGSNINRFVNEGFSKAIESLGVGIKAHVSKGGIDVTGDITKRFNIKQLQKALLDSVLKPVQEALSTARAVGSSVRTIGGGDIAKSSENLALANRNFIKNAKTNPGLDANIHKALAILQEGNQFPIDFANKLRNGLFNRIKNDVINRAEKRALGIEVTDAKSFGPRESYFNSDFYKQAAIVSTQAQQAKTDFTTLKNQIKERLGTYGQNPFFTFKSPFTAKAAPVTEQHKEAHADDHGVAAAKEESKIESEITRQLKEQIELLKKKNELLEQQKNTNKESERERKRREEKERYPEADNIRRVKADLKYAKEHRKYILGVDDKESDNRSGGSSTIPSKPPTAKELREIEKQIKAARFPQAKQIAENKEAAKYAAELQKYVYGIDNTYKGILSSAGKLLITAAKWILAYKVVHVLLNSMRFAYTELIHGGVEFYKAQEQQTLGLKGLIAENYNLLDAQNNQLKGLDKIEAAGQIAASTWSKLQAASFDVVGTTKDLMEIFNAINARVSMMNGTLDDAVTLVKGATLGATAMGVSFATARTSLVSILNGSVRMSNAFTASLGITEKQVKKLMEEGKLLDFLKEKFRGFIALQSESNNLFQARMETMKELTGFFGKAIVSPYLDYVKDTVKDIQDSVGAINKDSLSFEFNSSSKQAMREVTGAVASTVKPLVEFKETLFKSIVEIMPIINKAFADVVPVLINFGEWLLRVSKNTILFANTHKTLIQIILGGVLAWKALHQSFLLMLRISPDLGSHWKKLSDVLMVYVNSLRTATVQNGIATKGLANLAEVGNLAGRAISSFFFAFAKSSIILIAVSAIGLLIEKLVDLYNRSKDVAELENRLNKSNSSTRLKDIGKEVRDIKGASKEDEAIDDAAKILAREKENKREEEIFNSVNASIARKKALLAKKEELNAKVEQENKDKKRNDVEAEAAINELHAGKEYSELNVQIRQEEQSMQESLDYLDEIAALQKFLSDKQKNLSEAQIKSIKDKLKAQNELKKQKTVFTQNEMAGIPYLIGKGEPQVSAGEEFLAGEKINPLETLGKAEAIRTMISKAFPEAKATPKPTPKEITPQEYMSDKMEEINDIKERLSEARNVLSEQLSKIDMLWKDPRYAMSEAEYVNKQKEAILDYEDVVKTELPKIKQKILEFRQIDDPGGAAKVKSKAAKLDYETNVMFSKLFRDIAVESNNVALASYERETSFNKKILAEKIQFNEQGRNHELAIEDEKYKRLEISFNDYNNSRIEKSRAGITESISGLAQEYIHLVKNRKFNEATELSWQILQKTKTRDQLTALEEEKLKTKEFTDNRIAAESLINLKIQEQEGLLSNINELQNLGIIAATTALSQERLITEQLIELNRQQIEETQKRLDALDAINEKNQEYFNLQGQILSLNMKNLQLERQRKMQGGVAGMVGTGLSAMGGALGGIQGLGGVGGFLNILGSAGKGLAPLKDMWQGLWTPKKASMSSALQVAGLFGGASLPKKQADEAASKSVKVGVIDGFKSLFSGGGKDGKAGGVFGTIGGVLGNVGSALGKASPFIEAGLAIFSIFTGLFKRAAARIAKQVETEIKNISDAYQNGNVNMVSTIQALEAERVSAITRLSGKKGGQEQLDKIIPELDKMIQDLKNQQKQIIIGFKENLEVLRQPTGQRSLASSVIAVAKAVKEYTDATNDFVLAQEYMKLSLADLEEQFNKQLLDSEKQAIDDAIELNDLLEKRNEIVKKYNDEELKLRGKGSIERQLPAVVQAGKELAELRKSRDKELADTDRQISVLNAKLAGEKELFSISTNIADLKARSLQLEIQSNSIIINQLKEQMEIYRGGLGPYLDKWMKLLDEIKKTSTSGSTGSGGGIPPVEVDPNRESYNLNSLNDSMSSLNRASSISQQSFQIVVGDISISTPNGDPYTIANGIGDALIGTLDHKLRRRGLYN